MAYSLDLDPQTFDPQVLLWFSDKKLTVDQHLVGPLQSLVERLKIELLPNPRHCEIQHATSSLYPDHHFTLRPTCNQGEFLAKLILGDAPVEQPLPEEKSVYTPTLIEGESVEVTPEQLKQLNLIPTGEEGLFISKTEPYLNVYHGYSFHVEERMVTVHPRLPVHLKLGEFVTLLDQNGWGTRPYHEAYNDHFGPLELRHTERVSSALPMFNSFYFEVEIKRYIEYRVRFSQPSPFFPKVKPGTPLYLCEETFQLLGLKCPKAKKAYRMVKRGITYDYKALEGDIPRVKILELPRVGRARAVSVKGSDSGIE
ncbi:MAG: hypothetical protein S4CHLAM81_06730 [Chlamydiales bacterium]|nr:hypothetical protein [Chlamydiales bacterium]MCH9635457.1 hypothetical protein [Chlamydiales bacterium]MCH9703437.1 hypothetical protein [Chlamydiota bacterium]